jgi:hypothetical protein
MLQTLIKKHLFSRSSNIFVNTKLQNPTKNYSVLNVQSADHLIQTFTNNLRLSIIRNTKTAQDAQRRHQLNSTDTKLLGKTMATVSLMASFLNGEERIKAIFNGNGRISVQIQHNIL